MNNINKDNKKFNNAYHKLRLSLNAQNEVKTGCIKEHIKYFLIPNLMTLFYWVWFIFGTCIILTYCMYKISSRIRSYKKEHSSIFQNAETIYIFILVICYLYSFFMPLMSLSELGNIKVENLLLSC